MKTNLVKAIILAGGYSKRINSKTPKQLARIKQKPLLAYTLDAFEQSPAIDSIILVVNRRYVFQFRRLINQYGYKKIERLSPGGTTRQQSVFNALRWIRDCDYIIVHDGVRPFVEQKIIFRMLRAAKRFAAVTCAVKVTDTILSVRGGFINSILYRGNLMAVQTPQAFKFALLLRAHQQARAKKIFRATDDAQLVLKMGKKIKVIPGSYSNLKVTTPFDLDLAKILLSR